MITAPVDFLRDIHVVDTPGTNAVIREHEAITADFVPRSDLVLFVSSADRPFTLGDALARDTRESALRAVSEGNGAGQERVADGIAPYSRFVRAEQQSLTGLRSTLDQLRETLAALHARVTALT